MSRKIGASKSWVIILIYKFTNYHCFIFIILTCLFLTDNAVAADGKQPLFEAYKKVIVIDPGHGGNDFGARGPNGATEKVITLNLARILATELKRIYRVVLTRTDDHQVNIEQRTGAANHHRADLFISIHTGGSFVHSTRGILIFHYHNFTERPPIGGGPALTGEPDKDTPILWDQAQSRYLAQSRILARMINTRLSSLKGITGNQVQGAPLAVLQGAAMPAILIEIGYLTNSATEKKFQDQRFLIEMAQAISRGIDEYFERNQ